MGAVLLFFYETAQILGALILFNQLAVFSVEYKFHPPKCYDVSQARLGISLFFIIFPLLHLGQQVISIPVTRNMIC